MRRDLPTGAVTFVLTDIEGSTKLLRELGPEAYASALAGHRRVVRAACAAHGGVEVDTQGDAFFLVFASPSEALAAAASIAGSEDAGPIRVRIGIHSGPATITDEGYVGEAVHLGARVAAAAHGGQVVLTQATRAALGADVALQELGEHRLRDFTEPVPLFQLGTGSFPPLRTVANTNLPRPPSSFVGRRRELEAVVGALRSGVRLVTLTGPGGTGKTRLAIEAASVVVNGYPAGVFWVGLAAVRDPALITTTIEQALGARVGLAEHIADREMLLVLDNFEQVVAAAPELSRLLGACPRLALMVTSRELLRVDGEVEYRVPALDRGEAVTLFSQRSGRPSSAAVAELCARLDDLPLAVELAAARSRVLTPDQILDRLADRLDLLTGGRDADPRQRTLRATIEWSVELLSDADRSLFRRLAVFAGGTTLDAAQSVVGAQLDTLQSLVEKSLVRLVADRFRMLETIREYADELLSSAAESHEIRERFAGWVADLAETAAGHLERADQDVWLDRLAEEHDNIRSALAWSIEQGDADGTLRIAGSVAAFWWIKGYWSEGDRWLTAALSLPGGQDDAARARALEGAANLDVRLGDLARATPRARESLEICRRLDDGGGIARALRIEGLIAWGHDDRESVRRVMGESATAARAAGDGWALSMALNNLGYLALEDATFDLAGLRFEEAVELARSRGDQRSEAFFLENLALARLGQGAGGAARGSFALSLSLAHHLGFLEVVATDLMGAAALAVGDGEPGTAALLMGGAERLVLQTGGELDSVESRLRETTAAAIDRSVGARGLEDGLEVGRATEPDAMIALALDILGSSGRQGVAGPPTHDPIVPGERAGREPG